MDENDPRLSASDYWDSDDEHPVSDWQYEVANGDTRLGYHAWLTTKREEDQ